VKDRPGRDCIWWLDGDSLKYGDDIGERGRNRTFNLLIKSHFHRYIEIY
jgi:hypothetical protein